MCKIFLSDVMIFGFGVGLILIVLFFFLLLIGLFGGGGVGLGGGLNWILLGNVLYKFFLILFIINGFIFFINFGMFFGLVGFNVVCFSKFLYIFWCLFRIVGLFV